MNKAKLAKLEQEAEKQMLFAVKATAHYAILQLVAAGMTEQEAKDFTYEWLASISSVLNSIHLKSRKTI